MDKYRKIFVIAHDLLMIVIAWQIAWLIRFNFNLSFYSDWPYSIKLVPLIILLQGLLFWYFHLYRGLWRFASLLDLWNIFRSSIVGALVFALVFFMLFRLEGIPRSVLLLYPVFLIFLLGGPRLGYRLWKDKNSSILSAIVKNKVLIIGAGRAGDMLVRDLLRSKTDMPVAILDDNLALSKSEIHGIKIYGPIDHVKQLADNLDIDWIAIAIPSAQQSEIQRIIELCEQAELPTKILPDIHDINANNNPVMELREISIEDLLGRDQVDLDWEIIQTLIKHKRVLVTGGGGSIGFVLCQKIIKLAPEILIVIDNSEFNLYKAKQELDSYDAKIKTVFILGDICNKSHMDSLFSQYHPQLVFHAAAYKHVPILQNQPREALRNNILGTKVILDLSCIHDVEKFIMISTDKAVNPMNILGVSKRIAEIYTESMSMNANTKCITVRFGNVLGSTGSVVPLFKEQLKNGGPITVTHPDITRYFMTISEAAELILQAGAMGHGGEIFVLDMGEPVKIKYLAEQIIMLSGRKLGEDIEITYTGLRPGEKLYEELFYDTEKKKTTPHEKIFLAKHANTNEGKLAQRIDDFIESHTTNEISDIADAMYDFLNELEDKDTNINRSKT